MCLEVEEGSKWAGQKSNFCLRKMKANEVKNRPIIIIKWKRNMLTFSLIICFAILLIIYLILRALPAGKSGQQQHGPGGVEELVDEFGQPVEFRDQFEFDLEAAGLAPSEAYRQFYVHTSRPHHQLQQSQEYLAHGEPDRQHHEHGHHRNHSHSHQHRHNHSHSHSHQRASRHKHRPGQEETKSVEDGPPEEAADECSCSQHEDQLGGGQKQLVVPSKHKGGPGQYLAQRFEPLKHRHDLCQRCTINVGGLKFETTLRTLNQFPDSLLGDQRKRIR